MKEKFETVRDPTSFSTRFYTDVNAAFKARGQGLADVLSRPTTYFKKINQTLLKTQDKISRAPWIYIKGDRGKTPFRKANFYLRRRCADPNPGLQESGNIPTHSGPPPPPRGVWQNLKDGLNPCLWDILWFGREIIILTMVAWIEYIARVKAESLFKLYYGVFPGIAY